MISPENGDPAEVINLPDAETLDMAATPSTAIILLKGSDGLRDLVALRWKGE